MRSDDEDARAAGLAGRMRRIQWLGVTAFCTLLGLAIAALWHVVGLHRLWRGEVDLAGERSYDPPHGVDVARLRGLDHARIHAELLPAWIIAAARERRADPSADEAQTYAELAAAVASDPNLTDLVEELRGLARSRARFAEDPRRALYLTWAWSEYLDRHQIPYQVHGSVKATPYGPILSAMAYVTVGDAEVWVGPDPFRVRVGSRIDGTNARELYLGAAGRDEAIIVADRLEEFALTDLWPLLHENLDEMLDDRRSFAAAVRADARARLQPGDARVLAEAAYYRWQIVSTLRQIHARHECGSTFRIHRVPWFGFPPERLERLRWFAFASAARPCPAITPEEIELLEVASDQLARKEGLQRAVGALVAWSAEHVAIHEGRHLADDARADGFDEPLACVSCDPQMGIVARAELSGYLASLAWSSSPATALYQACRALADDRVHHRGAPVLGPHAEALALLQRRLGPVCRDGPPPDLGRLARHLEFEMLGRSDPMALDPSFPDRLSL